MKRVIAMRSLVIAFATFYLALSPLSFGAVPPNAMFRANLERTGVYKTEGIQRLHGVKWKFKSKRVIEAWFSSPSVSDEVVYFGSDDNYLYAVNASIGELKWKFKTGDVVYSSPAVADGTVYVGSHDGYLYAVDAKTGNERWKFKTGYRVYSSPAVNQGMVYFGSADTYLYAVGVTSGNLLWKFKAGSWILSSPAIANGTIYFGCWDGYLYAVDMVTGQEK